MTEAYSVQAQLTMKSNVPEVVAQMVRGFENVNNLLKETQGNLGRLVSEFSALSGKSRGIGRLIEGMEKMASIKPNGAMLTEMNSMATAAREMATFTKEMQTAQAEMARSAQQTAKAYQEIAAANRRGGPAAPAGPGGGGSPGARQPLVRAASHTSLVDAGMGLGMAGDAGAGLLERSISAELEVQKYLASFRMNNTVSPGDMAAIRSKAEALVRSVPGTTIAENLHTIVDAFTVVGDLKEAMAGSESMARLNLLLSSLPGAKGKDPGFAAAQAVELMQRFYNPKTHEVDIGELNKQINAIARVAAGTGNRMSPEAYLAFTKQARTASMTANDKFLYEDAPAAMIAMGGSRFGTGLAALFTQFQTGTMTQNAANALKQAGLLDKNAVWKGGRVQDIGHHLRDPNLAGSNLVDWVRQDILGPNGALAQKKIDPNDKIAVARFLSSFTGRQTGLGVLAELVLGIGGVDKEAAKQRQTVQDPLATLQANDPNMKVKEFHAAENELLVQLGSALMGPAIGGLKALTTGLRDLTDWAKANPEAATKIALIAGGMTVLAKVAGDLAIVIFIGAPLVGGMKALAAAVSPFGTGGAAGGALVRLTAGGAGSLGALSGGIIGLGAAVLGTVGLIKGFQALNDALGLHPGKGNGPNAAPSPSGNYFMDGIKEWWKGFSAPQLPNPHPNGRGLQGATRSPAGWFTAPPSSGSGQPLVIHVISVLDGKKVGAGIGRSMMGPNTGTTGFDLRTGYSGSMPA